MAGLDIGRVLADLLPFLGAGASGFIQGEQQGQEFQRGEELLRTSRQDRALRQSADDRDESRLVEQRQLNALQRQRDEAYLRPTGTSPSIAAAYGKEFGVSPEEAGQLPIGVTEGRLPGLAGRDFRLQLENLKQKHANQRAQNRDYLMSAVKDATLTQQKLFSNIDEQNKLRANQIYMNPIEFNNMLSELQSEEAQLRAIAGGAGGRVTRHAEKDAKAAGVDKPGASQPGQLDPAAMQQLINGIAADLMKE